MAQLADGSVLVIREDIDDDRGAARAVGFVLRLLVRDAGLFARAAANGALDVFGGHVLRLCIRDDRAQPRVHVRIAAAGAGRDGQFLDEAGENPAALGVEGALFVFDTMPLRVS